MLPTLKKSGIILVSVCPCLRPYVHSLELLSLNFMYGFLMGKVAYFDQPYIKSTIMNKHIHTTVIIGSSRKLFSL